MSALSLATAQEQFTATLGAVEDAVRFAFRGRLRRQAYEEARADALAAAWSAWHGLVTRGKDPLEVGVHGIANNAIRYVKNRRRIGNVHCGRGAMSIEHPRAQQRDGFKVISLDSDDASIPGADTGSWREWIAADNRVNPADEAAFRLDFAAWLASLPPRKRAIAELLAEGHEGIAVARTLGITPGRVSQVRLELEASWEAFQAQAGAEHHRAGVATA